MMLKNAMFVTRDLNASLPEPDCPVHDPSYRSIVLRIVYVGFAFWFQRRNSWSVVPALHSPGQVFAVLPRFRIEDSGLQTQGDGGAGRP